MAINRISIFIAFIIISISVVNSEIMNPRFDSSCGLLMNKIYCFGGFSQDRNNGVKNSPDNTINMLDLSALDGTTALDLESKWVPISPITAGVNIEPRYRPQFIRLPDEKTMLFNGGSRDGIETYGNSTIKDQTITYNASSNSWSKYPNYSENPYGDRQIYYASSVDVPGLGVGFYGGLEQTVRPNWTIPMDRRINNDHPPTPAGFTQLTFFNIANVTMPWSIPTPQINLPREHSVNHTSVYDPVSQNVYFFGGSYYSIDSATNTVSNATLRSLSYSLYYNVPTKTWGNESWSGIPPCSRFSHSTILLPSTTNRYILFYGGRSYDTVNPDFCFLLNLETKKWTQVAVTGAPVGAPLMRYGHSTVLVGNDTLFLLFGGDSHFEGTSSVVLLDVSNPTNISYMDTYGIPIQKKTSSGLSSGETAGIAIASTAVGLILVGVVFFIHKKRKQAREQNKEAEMMEVDWDAIENKFEEMPSEKFPGNNFSPVMHSEGSSTVKRSVNETPESFLKTSMTIPDAVTFHTPNLKE